MRELRWLLRAKRWAQNPPSEDRVKLVVGVVVLCLVIVAVERWIGWPEWATLDPASRRDVLR